MVLVVVGLCPGHPVCTGYRTYRTLFQIQDGVLYVHPPYRAFPPVHQKQDKNRTINGNTGQNYVSEFLLTKITPPLFCVKPGFLPKQTGFSSCFSCICPVPVLYRPISFGKNRMYQKKLSCTQPYCCTRTL